MMHDKTTENIHIKNSILKPQPTPCFSVWDSESPKRCDGIMVNGLDIQHIIYRHSQ